MKGRRTKILKVNAGQVNYVKVGDRLPFAFWIQSGKIHVSLINNKDYEVNVIGSKEE